MWSRLFVPERRRLGFAGVISIAVALTDMQGRLQGKRIHAPFFLDRVLQHGTEACNYLLAVDVDLFKEVNDARGHAAGDQVLRAVASALRRTGREADVVARTGGDEFSMLLPSCSLEDAIGIALALRELVIAHTARIGPPVTVSVGVATMPASATTPEGLMAAADDALYADKVARRDGELVRPD